MLAKKGFCLIFFNSILEHIFERKPNLLKTTQGLNKKIIHAEKKFEPCHPPFIFSIGKEQKLNEINEQD